MDCLAASRSILRAQRAGESPGLFANRACQPAEYGGLIARGSLNYFFSLYAREGRNENPPLLARQETGISFADIRSIGPSGPSVIVTVLKENA